MLDWHVHIFMAFFYVQFLVDAVRLTGKTGNCLKDTYVVTIQVKVLKHKFTRNPYKAIEISKLYSKCIKRTKNCNSRIL